MQGLFEFFLGHSAAAFREGRILLQGPADLSTLAAGLVLIGLMVWLLYLRTTVRATRGVKAVLMALRTAVLVLLALCLLRPVLRTSEVVPRESYLAVLIDDSRSMSIPDLDNRQRRSDAAAGLLFGEGRLVETLGENFRLRLFRFDRETGRINGPGDLQVSGSRTSLTRAMHRVADEMKGLPVSGLVLLTDGGDNDHEDPVQAAAALKSLNMPVFAVGIGREEIAEDRRIDAVSASQTVMEGSIFDVHTTVVSSGYRNRSFDLEIEQDGTIVQSKQFAGEASGAVGRYTIELTPEREGRLVYTVHVPEEADEVVTENNRRSFLVDNRKKQSDILYLEGHPRNEYKFIRRAIGKDETIRLATYLQTGPHKYLRQGIETPDELLHGFPKDREELYRYEAVIVGDLPPTFFTSAQLGLLRDFVSVRGGGFLMIGGSTGFDEGYIDTPVADLLPVTLVRERSLPPQLRGGARNGNHPTGQDFAPRLTAAGQQAAQLRLAVDHAANAAHWKDLPMLRGVNATGRPKPGAIVLAEHPALRHQDHALPVIATERYGRGRTMVLTTASTWRWQMQSPVENASHERFWRQTLRWLAAGAPTLIEIALDREDYSAGDEVQVRVSVSDSAYAPVNDATVWLKVTGPTGLSDDVPLEWAIQENGIYTGSFSAGEEGVYQLKAAASALSGKVGEANKGFLVSGSVVEYTNPGMDAGLLGRIAEASGGRFYALADAGRLPEDVRHQPNRYTVEKDSELWDIPALFLLMLVLFGLEWMLRRRLGMS